MGYRDALKEDDQSCVGEAGISYRQFLKGFPSRESRTAQKGSMSHTQTYGDYNMLGDESCTERWADGPGVEGMVLSSCSSRNIGITCITTNLLEIQNLRLLLLLIQNLHFNKIPNYLSAH